MLRVIIKAVREIDPSAADYMVNEAPKLKKWNKNDDPEYRIESLADCFVWADSEQGHEYWNDIANQLGGQLGWGDLPSITETDLTF
jgi:hypothetical protein